MRRLAERLEAARDMAWDVVWGQDVESMPAWRRHLVGAARVVHMLARELVGEQLAIRAASLVYTTLLALVPALAVTFAVLEAFNVHQQFEPVLRRSLEPLGTRGPEVASRIIAFVEGLDLAALGSAGVAFLLLTVISLVYKVERSFNFTWRVERPRRLIERLSSYLTVVVLGPMLVFTALGISASFLAAPWVQDAVRLPGVGPVVALGGKLVPYLLVVAAFTFSYYYIPNTRVRPRSALFGGCVAGALWVVAGWLFASMVVGASKYALVYSSFAILVLFMMWLHIGWLILLVGASVSFYHQHPEHLGLLVGDVRTSNRSRERIGLGACCLVADRYRRGEPAPGAAEIARRMRVPLPPVEGLLRELARGGILVATRAEPPGWVPARDLHALGLREVLAALRAAHESRHLARDRIEGHPAADALLDAIGGRVGALLGQHSLADLLDGNLPLGSAVSRPTAVDTRRRDAAP